MQETFKKFYSLAEAAKVVSTDEKTIHLYTHKGLIHPHLSADQEACFTGVDCIRLKLIIRADQLGYDTDTIFDLIGHPEDVLKARDPVSACRDYATEKYKQIYNKLNQCEPLEQINKQADLKLITNYIKNLKNFQKNPVGFHHRLTIKTLAKKTPALLSSLLSPLDQPAVSIDEEDDHPRSILRLKPALPLWVGVSLCVLVFAIIALTVYFRAHSATDNAAPPRVAMQDAEKRKGTETRVAAKKTAAIPSPPQVIPMLESQSPSKSARSGAKPPVAPARTASGGQVPEANVAQLVDVEELSLWHDNLNHIYRSEFNILRNPVVNGQDHIAGFVFVVLEANASAGGRREVVMPNVELISGHPARFPKPARFSIRNYKTKRYTVRSDLPPDQVASAKVLVYSEQGDLLLDKPVSIDIRPYLSGHRTPRDTSRTSSIASNQLALGTPEKPESPPLNQTAETSGENRTRSDSIQGLSNETQPSREAMVPPGKQPQSAQIKPTTIMETASAPKATTSAMKSKPSSDSKEQPVVKPQKTDNPEAASWEQRSYDAAVNGNFDEAIAHATKAIELDPGRINPYINRAWAYIEKNMLEPAIQDSRTALAIEPENAYAFNNLGLALQLGAETQKALENYRKACDLGFDLGCQNLTALTNQSRIASLLDQSQAIFKAGDWDGVVRATTEVIHLDPQNAAAHVNRSAAYAQKSYLNKALKDSNEAIRINPDFALAYNNRGYVYELLNNDTKALADYLKSCSLGLDLGCRNFDRLNQTR